MAACPYPRGMISKLLVRLRLPYLSTGFGVLINDINRAGFSVKKPSAQNNGAVFTLAGIFWGQTLSQVSPCVDNSGNQLAGIKQSSLDYRTFLDDGEGVHLPAD